VAAANSGVVEKSRFPGVEPISKDQTSSISSRDRVDNAVKWADRAIIAMAKSTETNEPVRVYYMQERKMEELAIKRRIRGEFFSFLQTARDKARMAHRDCTSEIRQ
jgi:hypothetical protein